MTFLPIVDRELRVASRRRATYWLRFWLALIVIVLWLLLLGAGTASAAQRGQILFILVGVLALGFSMLAGIFLTADCLSEEKREGTLGLLFLTELKGYDVVLGKLMATSLHAFYGLLTVLPLLALPLLLGGVTVGEFWRVTLVLLATLFLSLAAGMVVSSLSRDTRQAMAATLLVMLALAGIMPGLWWLQRLFLKSAAWDVLLWTSPVYLFARAFDVYFRFRSGMDEFWRSLLTLLCLGASALGLAGWRLPWVWRETREAARSGKPSGGSRRSRFGSPRFRLKRRLRLEENPFYWLASRDRLPGWLTLAILCPLFGLWLAFLPGSFSKSFGTRSMSISIAVMTAFVLHQVLKGLMAVEAARRLSDDRHSGALELLLVTPLSVPQILDGQSRALKELFRGPLLLAAAMNGILIWIFLISFSTTSEPSTFFCEMCVGGMIMLLLDFSALSWVGMWMALRSRKHHRAIFATMARIMLPPWLGILFMYFFLLVGGGAPTSEELVGWIAIWFALGAALDLAYRSRAKNALAEGLRQSISYPDPNPCEAAAGPQPPLLTAQASDGTDFPTFGR